MKTLRNYIHNSNIKIDGHLHMFDHNGVIDSSLINDTYKCVCFADIVFKRLYKYNEKKIISYYDDFIANHYDSSKHILLATGITSEEIIEIYNKYPNIIKGFGELKCYGEFNGGKLPYDNLKWIKPLLEFNRTIKLPVYIHYELIDDTRYNELEQLLKEYPEIPFVLCHCGMINDKQQNMHIHRFILSMINKYDNLYIDISTCKTREFYLDNLGCLMQFNQNKIIVGSDINPIAKKSNIFNDYKRFKITCYKQFNQIYKFIKPTGINKLFNL